jgi:diguanylate cyclase (GGDEF)-like protein/PAS domain S-box-containing protein
MDELLRRGRAGAVISHDETHRLRLLLDRLPALVGYWDRNLRNVIANAAYVEYFGFTPQEAYGRHIREILGEAVYALNLPYIERALIGEEQLFERTLIDQYGATRYTQASYLPDIVDGEVQGFYVQVTDVTARVEAEHARDEAQRLFEIGMANAPFGEAVLTPSAQTLHINPSLCALLGYAADELIGRDFREVIHPDDRPSADSELIRLQDRSAAQVASERRYLRRDGTTIWMQRAAVLVPGAHGGDDVIVTQFQDVTARRHAEAELARLAMTDSLTGLHNRHALALHIEQRRTPDPDVSVGIVFIDLDGFKQVNDTHGHSTGDAVLVEAAQRLSQVIEPPDSAYRLGGDEFVVLVPGSAGGKVEALAKTIRTAVTGSYATPTTPVTLTASVGWTWGAGDVEALLRQADADMYRQKPKYPAPLAIDMGGVAASAGAVTKPDSTLSC